MIPISSFQASILSRGAIVEKIAPRPPGFRGRVVPKVARPIYENVLTAILLYGKAATVEPTIAHAHLGTLQSDYDIIEPIAVDSESDFERRLTRTYENGFDSFRRRESRLAAGAPVIVEDRVEFPKRTLDEELDDIQDDEMMSQAIELCTSITFSILDVLRMTHGKEFERGWFHHAGAFSEYLGDHESVVANAEESESSLTEHIQELLADLPYHMGLYCDQGMVDAARVGALPVFFNFDPQEMAGVFETEEMMASPRSDFTNHLQQGLLLGMRPSPAKFLACHALWRTVFEFTRMTRYAQEFQTQLLGSSQERGQEGRPMQYEDKDEQVCAYQLLSDNLPTVPRVTSISQLLRLRDDRHLPALRECIKAWTDALLVGDGPACSRIARDVDSATKALERATKLQAASQTLNYVTIPLSIAEALAGTCFGLLLLPIGPCLDMAASRVIGKNSWVQFGKAS